MSKTYCGEKGPGYEYWSRRANGEGKELSRPGRTTKKLTNKRERRLLRKKLKEFE